MIAPYYLALTVWFGSDAVTINSIPMQNLEACQTAGQQYVKLLEDTYARTSFSCLKTSN